ncbi:Protein kintoun [Chytriomyces hyalinus]|nr:Protein kintoun [Chytriomyces hyalinus]
MASATDFGDKLTATPEEIERISKAMKNKEFRDLFHEYIQEISDPKNKELYEREIEALEADRGNNIRWVKPTPGRVLKTRFKSKPAKNSELRDIEKVFINMCTSSEIEEASIARPDETKNGERGQQWSIPYSLDAGRVDVDKSGGKCFVYDCVFNPKTYELGSKMTKFMDLLVQTSLDGVEQRFAVTLDRDVKPLYKTKYKGDIKATVIRTKTDEKNPKTEKKTSLDFIEKVQADKQQTLNQPKPQRPTPPTRTIITGNRYRAGQVASDAVDDAPRNNTAAASAEAAPLQPQRRLFQELPSVPQQPATSNQPTAVPSPQSIPQTTTPTYTVTHRASLAYTNYMQTRDRSEANPPRPDALVLSIDLPKCTSATEVSLDTVKNGWACHIHAGFSNGAGEYDVNIDLPFQVTEEGGNAQFDKARRVLRVELPCVPAPREEIPLADVPFEADEVVDGGAEQTESVRADSQFENDVRDAQPADNDAETKLVSKQETISENTLTANTIEPEIAPLQCQPVESNTASKAPAPTGLLQQASIDTLDAESTDIVADQPTDIEMEDDIHAALSSLQPCVPRADELEQLAHAAVKSGMMGPSWNVKSIDDVFELALDDGNVADEAEEVLTVGESQTHVVELKKDTCLKSRLIFEVDD